MDLLLFLWHRSVGAIILAVLAGIISGAASTSLIAIISAVASRSQPSPGRLAWIFVGLCLAMALARYISAVSLAGLVQGAIFELRMLLSRKIIAAPLRDLEKAGSHRLLGILTDDVSIIANMIVNIPSLSINLTMVAGCLAYLAWLSVRVFLFTLAFMVVGAIIYKLMMGPSIRLMMVAREHRDLVFKNIKALLEGSKELRLHKARRDAFLSNHLIKVSEEMKRQNTKYMTIYTIAISVVQSLLFVLIAVMLFSPFLLAGSDAQAVVGGILALLFLSGPLEAIIVTLPGISRANVSLKKVKQLGLKLKDEPDDAADAADDSKPRWDRIDLEGVLHVYHREDEDKEFTLGPIDLTLYPGELVFLMGGNGSGKTTLAKIIAGLYAPEKGSILLDGKSVGDENRDEYRQYFSAVFSEFYIFENHDYMSAATIDGKGNDYLAQLKLGESVRIEDKIFRYGGLSQGQMKRLALLTACLEDRPIYIFDEWAADQDPAFKHVFYCEILPRLKSEGKTALVISHDDRYYHMADRIVKLDYGRIDYDIGDQKQNWPASDDGSDAADALPAFE